MSEYDDIISLPHHVSKKHKAMPLSDRAAQFAPFSALTGYEACVKEAAEKVTDKNSALDRENFEPA